MKPISTLIPFFWILTLGAFGQSTWTQQSPKPGNLGYMAVHFTSLDHGVAISYTSKQAVTQNGGTHWYYKPAPGILSISSYHDFPTDSVGYLTGQNAPIYKTKDGGNTWQNTGQGNGILRISFLDKNVGYGLKDGSIHRTSNGGASWKMMSSIPAYRPYKFVTVSQSHLYGLPDAQLLPNRPLTHSVDSGKTWSYVDFGSTRAFNSIEFFDENLGWAGADSGVIYRTTNGGQNWIKHHVPFLTLEYGYVEHISFLNSQKGWILVGRDQFFTTTDGGISWSYAGNVNNAVIGISNFQFLDSLNGWCSGDRGLIARTTDGGHHWVIQTKGSMADLKAVDSQNQSRIWAVGNDAFYSNDKGKNWTTLIIDSLHRSLFGVQFLTPLIGYLADESRIYKTTNGGVSWKKQEINSGAWTTTDMFFLNPDTGWITSQYHGFARTLNGGQTWEFLDEAIYPNPQTHLKVFFSDFNHGMLLTRKDNFTNKWELSTLSQGGTVRQVSIDDLALPSAVQSPASLQCMGAGYAWVKFSTGEFLRTINGGASWKLTPPVYVPYVYNAKFISPDIGYAVCDSGLAITQDSGVTWHRTVRVQNASSSTGITDFLIQNGKPVLAVGSGGGIWTSDPWAGENLFTATGKIVKNLNNDCVLNTNESGLPGRIVVSEPDSYFGVTDPDGNYSIQIGQGSYSLKQIPSSSYNALFESQLCPPGGASVLLNVNGLIDPIPSNNFINEVKNCPLLVLSQDQNILRPCRRSTLILSVQNEGNAISDTEQIYVKFPPQLHFVSASAPFVYSPTDSTYNFKISPLLPFQSFHINIDDSLACEPVNLIGKTMCVKATIPNAPACLLQSPGWDGANLEVASRCQNGQTKFTLHNNGAAMSSTSQYQIFIDSALVYQAPFQLAANGAMTVSIPVNAPSGFVRLVVPQSANHPLSTFASAEANCATGQSTNGLFPPPDESPLVDIECVIVRNSFDPNDKLVFPTGWGTAGNVEPLTEFKYTVRFQNTGTDTAFKVMLIDTLDEDLDIASLQIGNASHPNQFSVSGKGRPVLRWTFDNILLPDSNNNEEKSHGFVSYSIRPKAGLSLGTKLENFADIYFDFNDPVRTNTTVNTLWQPTYSPGILDTVFTSSQKVLTQTNFQIHPNPSKGKLELSSREEGWLSLYNVKGEEVYKGRVGAGQNHFNFTSFPKGLYLIRTQVGDLYQTRKLILE